MKSEKKTIEDGGFSLSHFKKSEIEIIEIEVGVRKQLFVGYSKRFSFCSS